MSEAELDYEEYWREGLTWEEYLAREVEEHRDLWEGVYRKHETPEWAVRRAEGLDGEWNLLVISEDWCGDASNTVPVLARLAEAAANVNLRVVGRDENPELMDRYLTDGSRSIPLAVLLDGDLTPRGRWGPRPEELQEFVISEKEKGERPTGDIYRDARQWYARDGGETTLRELVAEMEEAGAPVA